MHVRALLALLILLVSLTTSGITSAIAATITGEDCCADGESEATQHADNEQAPEGGGERDECPPLCHACACSPMFAVPELVGPHIVTRELQSIDPIDGYSQLPTSPPGTDVFHPPRRTA